MLTWIIVLSLGSYRVWRLAALDTITAPIRDRMGDRLAEYVSCPWCPTVPIAAATTWVADLTVGLPAPVAIGAAVAAVTAVLADLDVYTTDRLGGH